MNLVLVAVVVVVFSTSHTSKKKKYDCHVSVVILTTPKNIHVAPVVTTCSI